MGSLVVALIAHWRCNTGNWTYERANGKEYPLLWGLLLLNNPDIELISVAGALLMCVGYIPWGVKLLNAE